MNSPGPISPTALRQYQSPGQKKFRLADVKRLFEMMRWKG
jgi:hypothetical protein